MHKMIQLEKQTKKNEEEIVSETSELYEKGGLIVSFTICLSAMRRCVHVYITHSTIIQTNMMMRWYFERK